MFYLRKQHICEVETRELFDHSLLKAACFQLRHFSSTEMSRGWRRTGGPPVISVASLVSLQYIRYEHMKMSFFWSTPCFHMAFIGWFVEVPRQTSFFTCNTCAFWEHRENNEKTLLERWSIPNLTRNWRSYVPRQPQAPSKHCRCKMETVLGHSLPVWMYSGRTRMIRMCCRKYMVKMILCHIALSQ